MFSNDTKQAIAEAQNFFSKGTLEKIHSIHHKLPRTKANVKKFPLFIDSPMNGVGLSFYEHSNNSHLYRITEKEAEVYEWFLEKLVKIGGNQWE